jgi:hypothetical protein
MYITGAVRLAPSAIDRDVGKAFGRYVETKYMTKDMRSFPTCWGGASPAAAMNPIKTASSAPAPGAPLRLDCTRGNVECFMTEWNDMPAVAAPDTAKPTLPAAAPVRAPVAVAPPKPKPPVEADPEPSRGASAAGVAAEGRKFALKEGPEVLAYCKNDPTLSGAFDCAVVQRAVYAHRTAAAAAAPGAQPEPLANLFTGDKLDCTVCVNKPRQTAWARREAITSGLKPPVATCVAAKFVENVKAKPYLNRVREEYDAAVAGCK